MALMKGGMAALLLLAMTGCGSRVEESAKAHSRCALEAAASDLLLMGFDVQSMALFEEACRIEPEEGRALEIAGRFA